MRAFVVLCLVLPSAALAQETLPRVELAPSEGPTATATVAITTTTVSAAPGGPRLDAEVVPPVVPPAPSETAAAPLVVAPAEGDGGLRLGAYYGYQGLLLRVAGFGLLGLAYVVGPGSEGLATVMTGAGILVAGVGPLVVHVLHDRVDHALYSLGSSLVLGTLGLVIGAAATPDEQGGLGKLGGAVLGTMIGAGVAVVLDATLFGFERAPEESGGSVAVVPTMVRGMDGSVGAGLGLVF